MISPNPGPTFEIDEADAEMHVRKSSPLKESKRAEIAKVKILLAQNEKGKAKEIIERLLNENDLSTDHKQSVQEMRGMAVS